MADLEDIVRREAGMIRRVAACYERRPDRVDDLVQDVFLAVWRALPSFRGEASQRAYVARIAHNVCVSHVRGAVRNRADVLDEATPDPAPLPDELADGALARRRLLAAMQDLPLPLRQAIILYLEDFSLAEIGAALDISENNAGVRINRAKTALRKAMTGNL